MTPLLTGAVVCATVVLPLGMVAFGDWHLKRQIQQRRERWDDIEELLKCRQTLAPRLAAIANLYMDWEHHLIADIGEARRHAMASHTVTARAATETALSWALARLMLIGEDHEQLVHHADFISVCEQIAKVERKLARLILSFNQHTDAITNMQQSPLIRVLSWLRRVPVDERFELDPLLARQAMIELLRLQPTVRPQAPGAAPEFPISERM